ncbi:MAG: UDP-N-acetylmuramate--L-alanine ligase [Elainellaceae cyanobacterium]
MLDQIEDKVDFGGRPFHFIGIGGIGMSAIAYVLLKHQLLVSGSDKKLTHITQRLKKHGAHIFETQNADNLTVFSPQSAQGEGLQNEQLAAGRFKAEPLKPLGPKPGSEPQAFIPQVICSTAISKTNSEYQAALALGCPIFHRSDVLAGLMQQYRGIAVAGTHGKTTTTSMIGYVLLKAGLDPTIIVGGEVGAWQGNARTGAGDYLVAEADESDGSLVKLSSQIGIVTNIELDHPDHYQSIEDVVHIFQKFSRQCQILIASADCETVARALDATVTYSINPERRADYVAKEVTYAENGTRALIFERGRLLGAIQLQVLGAHNLSNGLAAIALGRLLGLTFETIAEALSGFKGARRRYELRGQVNQITFIDDYAHHPSEIQVTLTAARLQAQSKGRIIAVFQPHRYSRTLALIDEFAQSFTDADCVVITDVYAAGEVAPAAVTGETLAKAIQRHHSSVIYQPTLPDVLDYLKDVLQPGDVALFLGAGNLNRIIPDLMTCYQQDASAPMSRHPEVSLNL